MKRIRVLESAVGLRAVSSARLCSPSWPHSFSSADQSFCMGRRPPCASRGIASVRGNPRPAGFRHAADHDCPRGGAIASRSLHLRPHPAGGAGILSIAPREPHLRAHRAGRWREESFDHLSLPDQFLRRTPIDGSPPAAAVLEAEEQQVETERERRRREEEDQRR